MRSCNYCGGELELDGKAGKFKCTSCGSVFPAEQGDAEYQDYLKKREAKERRRSKLKTKAKMAVVVTVALFIAFRAVPAAWDAFSNHQQRQEMIHSVQVKAPKSSSSYEGEDAKAVAAELESAGFGNITFTPVKDISPLNLRRLKGTIVSIAINGSSFSGGEWFDRDATVTISYHAKGGDEPYDPIVNYRKGQAKTLHSAKDLCGRNFTDVETELKSCGFSNVKVQPLNDLNFLTGIINHENTIAEVSINGTTDFDKERWFPSNATIVLKYHSSLSGDEKR